MGSLPRAMTESSPASTRASRSDRLASQILTVVVTARPLGIGFKHNHKSANEVGLMTAYKKYLSDIITQLRFIPYEKR